MVCRRAARSSPLRSSANLPRAMPDIFAHDPKPNEICSFVFFFPHSVLKYWHPVVQLHVLRVGRDKSQA